MNNFVMKLKYFFVPNCEQINILDIFSANIVQVLLSKAQAEHVTITKNHLMVMSGIWSVILSLATSPLVPNQLISMPSSMISFSGAMLLVSALITLVALWWIVLSVSLTQSPTLVSVLR